MALPKVSVLMSVFNGERFLGSAIESILGQTFADFEFLIINDCSNDRTKELIQSYNDFRIQLIDNEKNLGLTRSLNKGINLAKGEYIARMDSDDISYKNRLLKQVNFLDINKGIGVCGSLFRYSDTNDIFETEIEYEKIKVGLFRRNVMAHSSVMMRKSDLDKFNLRYNETLRFAQDYEFWVRCCRYFPVINLNEVLLIYGRHVAQISNEKKALQDEAADFARLSQLEYLEIQPNEEEKNLHLSALKSNSQPSDECIQQSIKWLKKLKEYNETKKYFSVMLFNRLLKTMEKEMVTNYFNKRHYNFSSLVFFFKSSLNPFHYYQLSGTLRYVIKCIIGWKRTA